VLSAGVDDYFVDPKYWKVGKRLLAMPFYAARNRTFAKTGSGQTEKTQNKMVISSTTFKYWN
jgi:hypothetical protein